MTRTHAPMVTHAELLALVPELRAAGIDPDELSDELHNAATTGCGTDSLASLRVEAANEIRTRHGDEDRRLDRMSWTWADPDKRGWNREQLLDFIEAAHGIICNAHAARVDNVTTADGASPGWAEAARAWIDAYPPTAAVPAPITAEDFRAAERAWEELPASGYSPYFRAGHVDPRAAFIADHLNRARDRAPDPGPGRDEKGDPT